MFWNKLFKESSSKANEDVLKSLSHYRRFNHFSDNLIISELRKHKIFDFVLN